MKPHQQVVDFQQVSESLAGRMEVLTLWPFSQGEIEGREDVFVDACFSPDFAPRQIPAEPWPALADLPVPLRLAATRARGLVNFSDLARDAAIRKHVEPT